MSSRSLNAFGSGPTTNIFSNDASQIELAVANFNYLWVIFKNTLSLLLTICFQMGPMITLAMIVFFWHFMKYISLIAVGYTVAIVFVISLFGRFIVYFR